MHDNRVRESVCESHLKSLWHVSDSDILVSVSEESSLKLTWFIHIVYAGFLLGLAQSSSPPPPLTASLLIFLLLLLSTQVLGQRERDGWLGKQSKQAYTHRHSRQRICKSGFCEEYSGPVSLCIYRTDRISGK